MLDLVLSVTKKFAKLINPQVCRVFELEPASVFFFGILVQIRRVDFVSQIWVEGFADFSRFVQISIPKPYETTYVICNQYSTEKSCR